MTTNPLRDQIAALPAHQPMLEFEDEESTVARCVMRQVDDGFWVRKRSVLTILDAQAPQAEPVAWRYRDAGEEWRISTDVEWMNYRRSRVSMDLEPLYTAPPSPQPTDNTALVEGGCGLPCGYDCNGACFAALSRAPQPASDALAEAARKACQSWANGCHDISWRAHFDGAMDDLAAALASQDKEAGE